VRAREGESERKGERDGERVWEREMLRECLRRQQAFALSPMMVYYYG
jgi:hypothetical protein